jgi:hypothetical protein
MRAPRFSVHIDQDDLAKQDLAAALPRRPGATAHNGEPAPVAAHHGNADRAAAARQSSERGHARTPAAGKARSYTFRRS